MRKQLLPFLALVTLGISVTYFLPEKNDRAEYAAYIKSHPYHPENRHQTDPGSIPRQDRPDLAWEQNFLMTMDPKLKRPTPEKLEAGRKQIAAFFEAKSNARTGTEDFPWIERGPREVGGRTRAIMWDPNDETGSKVWAGGVTGGLWFNENIFDNGSQWQKIDDFWESIAITSIVFDPTNTSVFYVGTGENTGGASRGEGIYKSTDGGANWDQLTASTEFNYINDLIVRDENGTGVLYAAVAPAYYEGVFHGVSSLGLQRSVNGGTSFAQVLPNIQGRTNPYAITDLELASDNTIWAGTVTNVFGFGGGFILKSTNGTTWDISTQRNPGDRIMLSSAPSDASVVYALVENDAVVEEVIKTTDGGVTWENLPEPADADDGIAADDFSRGQAWYDLIIEVDPNDEDVVLVGGIDLFKTDDGGTTWDQISHWYGGFGSQYVHADQHAILFKPGSSSDVLFGNDGGVYVSSTMDSATPTISMRNNGYNVTQFYACAIHPTQDNFFLAGAQDNGTHKFTTPEIGDTEEVYGGDGAYCFIDQTNGNFQISSYVYNVYARSTNNGNSFFDFVDDQNSGRFINPADYDDNLGILYTATDSLSIGRFTDIRTSPGRSDFDIDLNGDLASHLRVSPYQTTSTTLFVGNGIGNVFKIENADGLSPSPTDITGTLPEGYVSCIEIGATEDQLLVTFSNYGLVQVWESQNGGATWAPKNGNLPDMPVRWALYNPNNRSEVILATELGIWRTTDISAASPAWEPSSIGLANVRVDMLQIREPDYEVIAATHGRGLYSSSGFTPYEAPVAPTSLTLTVVNAREILVQWADNSDSETGFVIERSQDGIAFDEVAEVEPNITSYPDTGLEGESTYWYRVKAVNVSVGSAFTNEEFATTPIALPDLEVSELVVIQAGALIDLEITAINSGLLTIEDDIDVVVYWSAEDLLDENATALYSGTISGLAMDETTTLVESVDLPETIELGTNHFFVVIDPDNTYGEESEENNQAQTSFDIVPLSFMKTGKKTFAVYPVPTHGSLTIENTGLVSGVFHYTLTDLSGRTLASDKLSGERSILDVSNLKTGVYHLILQDGKGRYSYKISKR